MEPISIGLGLAGIASNLYGASQASQGLDLNALSNKAGTGYLDDWKAAFGRYSDLSDKYLGQADEYMDPTSGINQSLLNQFTQQGQDFSSMQNRMNQRNLSSGGMGGFSGLSNQQAMSFGNAAQLQAGNAWQQGLGQNRMLGLNLQGQGANLLDKYVQGQKGYGETMAQGYIQNDILRKQSQQAMFGGLGGGLLDLAGIAA